MKIRVELLGGATIDKIEKEWINCHSSTSCNATWVLDSISDFFYDLCMKWRIVWGKISHFWLTNQWIDKVLFSNKSAKFDGFHPKNMWCLLFCKGHIWKHSRRYHYIQVLQSGLKVLPEWLYQFKKFNILTIISKS